MAIEFIDKIKPKADAFPHIVDAAKTAVDTTNLTGNLSGADDDVQKALETLDGLPLGQQGPQGEPGVAGDTGIQGDTGVAGPQGDSGTTGDTGAQGDTGSSGAKGDTGSQGTAGVKGDTGTTGGAGAKGDTGSTGTTGDTGTRGDTGIRGDTGVTGDTGTKGDTGEAGLAGPAGDTGSQGSTGVQGDTGIQGDTGLQGISGDTGFQGDTGVAGDTGQGLQGDTGTQGPKGDTGAQGDTGPVASTDFSWRDPVIQYQSDPPTTPSIGDRYIVLTTGTGAWAGHDEEIAEWTDGTPDFWAFETPVEGWATVNSSDDQVYTFNGTYWASVGSITKGDTGTQGDTGIKGDTGSQGIQGAKGDTGTRGDTGIQGDTGKGDTGDQGIPGDTGTQGLSGDTGVAGDTGSQGPQGLRGDTGLDGDTGTQGDTGIQGDTGVGQKGDTGSIGLSGDTGTQGDTGVGTKGDTGEQGAQGVKGDTGTVGNTGAKGDTGVSVKGDTGVAGAPLTLIHATHNTTQNVVATTLTPLLFNTVTFVQGTEIGHPTSNNFTFSKTGKYLVEYNFRTTYTANNGWLRADVFLNGTSVVQGSLAQRNTGTGASSNSISNSFTASFAATNYIEFRAAAGGALANGWIANGVDVSITLLEGVVGPAGSQGDTGAQGPNGDTGTQGIQGSQGDTGVQGDTGLGFNFRGEFNYWTYYYKNDVVRYDYGSYVALIDNENNYPSLGGPYWDLLVAVGITGDTGEAGDTGIKGDTGSKGDTGTKGDTGEQGLQGDTGADSTVPGPKGDTGTQGDTGIQGDTGADSTVPGPKGDTGAKGDTGVKGDTGSSANLLAIQFAHFVPDTGAPSPHAEGNVFWDSGDHCLAFQTEHTDVVQQIGQEQWVRVYNNTGSQLGNGTVVTLSGAQGNRPTVQLADATQELLSYALGVVTHPIDNSSEGYVTTEGIVRGIDTRGWTPGQVLFLSPTTPGGYVTTPPDAPNHACVVAHVLNSTVNGSIYVHINVGHEVTELHDVLTSGLDEDHVLTYELATQLWKNKRIGVFTDTKEPTGFVTKTFTYSFNNTSREFQLVPNTSYAYYIAGKKYTITTTKTVTIPNTEGRHFIYFDGSTLASTTAFTSALLTDYVIVALLYWDATNAKQIMLCEEMHGAVMDAFTHWYLHSTRGAVLESGGNLANFVPDGNGSADNQAQFSCGDAVLWDEDVRLSLAGRTSTSNIAVYYRTGADASNYWRVVEDASFGVVPTGTGRAAYNQNNAGTWQLTEVTNTSHVLAHVFIFNDTTRRFGVIMGQAQYSTITSARSAAVNEINSIVVAGLPSPEMKFVGTIIYQTANNYGNTVKSRVVSTSTGAPYEDLREINFIGGGAGTTGDKGDTGVKGDTGTQGDTGISGEKGDTGADGYVGSDGDTGPQGDTGVAGDKGDTGADSTVPGPQGDTGVKGDTGTGGGGTLTDSMGVRISAGGPTIALGSKAYRNVAFDCTLTGWRLVADAAGTVEVDVKKCAFANLPNTVSIVGTEKPTLAAAQTAEDTNLTTWTTAVAAGDVLEFVVDSASGVKKLTVDLQYTREL